MRKDALKEYFEKFKLNKKVEDKGSYQTQKFKFEKDIGNQTNFNSIKDYAMGSSSNNNEEEVEENLEDSDVEDEGKNEKIQSIKNSKILSQKINEQSTYL